MVTFKKMATDQLIMAPTFNPLFITVRSLAALTRPPLRQRQRASAALALEPNSGWQIWTTIERVTVVPR